LAGARLRYASTLWRSVPLGAAGRADEAHLSPGSRPT
jgi:hypothetical protein